MLKEHQYKNAIIIDGMWYVPNDAEDGNDCETCALSDICQGGSELICQTIHDLGIGQNYIKLKD